MAQQALSMGCGFSSDSAYDTNSQVLYAPPPRRARKDSPRREPRRITPSRGEEFPPSSPYDRPAEPQRLQSVVSGGSSNGGSEGAIAVSVASSSPDRILTMAEVARHNTGADCWVIIDGNVYDVTSFLRRHPGGSGVIATNAGRDITSKFLNAHSHVSHKRMLAKNKMGVLA